MTQAAEFLSNVSHIMETQVTVVSPEESIVSVRAALEMSEGHPLPVVDIDGTFHGIITINQSLMDGPVTASQLAIRSRMTASPHESAFEIASRMLSKNVDWAPVLEGRKFAGVVTRECILAAFGETRYA